jgi:hypothetical protein
VTNSFGKIEKFHAANGKAQHALRNSPLFFSFFPVAGGEKGGGGRERENFPLFSSSSQRVPVFPILVLTKF